MTNEQKAVQDFHKKFGLTVNKQPTVISWRDIELRVRLIKEEMNEFRDASSLYSGDKHLVEVADALGDLLYVVYGAAVSYGIDLEPVFNEIHRSNMSKLWPDGTAHRDTGGKVIKSPEYSPANLLPIILIQKGEQQEALKEIIKQEEIQNGTTTTVGS